MSTCCSPHLPEVLSLDKDGSVGVGDICLRSGYVPFTVPSSSPPDALIKAKLPLRLVESKGLTVLARYAHAGALVDPAHWLAQLPLPSMSFAEIGRASCRERV